MFYKILSLLLITVAAKGIILGGYHLYLPTHWQWVAGLHDTPAMLKWALLALNDMWSVLMIILHSSLLFCFIKKNRELFVPLGYLLTSYWFAHAVIISIRPLPLPEQMQNLSMILTTIPYIQTSILLVATSYFRTKLVLKN